MSLGASHGVRNFIWLVATLLPHYSAGPSAYARAINSFTVFEVRGQLAETLRTSPDGAELTLPPYVTRLSSEWTVIEAPAWDSGRSQNDSTVEKLLHCRLPLPQTQNEVKQRVQRYVREQKSRRRTMLWKWLVNTMNDDGCIFADGEGAITGVQEWYLFCAEGKVLKVNKTAVAAMYTNKSHSSLEHAVRKLIGRFRSSGVGRARGGRTSSWAVLVGEYQRGVTHPVWNSEREAWEVLYPTHRACRDARRYVPSRSEFAGGVDAREGASASSSVPLHDGKWPDKEVWQTVVRLHCPWHNSGPNTLLWSVTEIRQTCTHELLLSSPAVCEWDRDIGDLHVNPIPCIPI
ncbi:hypothetical protein ERJ75_000037600 [Trypanosoma vivax]|uniref:Uncharacterized protein n=1 Tax=Trypanosoma vivax (strain Y486) TaxID=1055687 RepID=G0U7M6_TRYVY|nr:hypothetical protein TRVL_00395 [Trypanosoma vivax]KAH8620664.1 hypothetical protein ERJ75_000037600 [Trypanosoma vivax]CCC51884.1 conserved hypothetical protein [Trypanosoma vivax Y486]